MKGKVGNILYGRWIRFGMHYVTLFACYIVWIFNSNTGKLQPKHQLLMLSCAPIPQIEEDDYENPQEEG